MAAAPMVQQIEQLLRDDAPSLASVEDTLTEGYARALALEAERLRIEKRVVEVAKDASADQAAELRRLGTRLTSADGEIEHLRSLLGTLADRARKLRAAS
ncbi:MAG: hypothetical protein ABUS54_08520 [Actinomycetota bacterium]